MVCRSKNKLVNQIFESNRNSLAPKCKQYFIGTHREISEWGKNEAIKSKLGIIVPRIENKTEPSKSGPFEVWTSEECSRVCKKEAKTKSEFIVSALTLRWYYLVSHSLESSFFVHLIYLWSPTRPVKTVKTTDFKALAWKSESKNAKLLDVIRESITDDWKTGNMEEGPGLICVLNVMKESSFEPGKWLRPNLMKRNHFSSWT